MKILLRVSIAVCLSLFALGAVLYLHSPRTNAQSPPELPGVNHALIIGIGSYSEWPKLTSPAKDAETIAQTLISRYNFKKSNVTLLTDTTQEKPTLVNIFTRLDTLTRSLGADDNLLIYFSGHSTEDDDAETYWVPIDGKRRTKRTWLKHADLVEEYFSADRLKVKNLLVIADSLFSHRLFRTKAVPVTPFDLRYPEKIRERAERSSRALISFGDKHWPGDDSTNGKGLLAFYLNKALTENAQDIIDFENLIFDENILFPISKIAGTKLQRGRFKKAALEKSGQFVVARAVVLPLADVLEAVVAPEKGYPGDPFVITARTNQPASRVYVMLQGQRTAMTGEGTEWRLETTMEKLGQAPFRVTAFNPNDLAGKPADGKLIVIHKKAEATNVARVTVQPAKGFEGDRFTFQAVTDIPARSVSLSIAGTDYAMKGSGTQWSLKQAVKDIGQLDYTAVATNEDGVQGRAGSGKIVVQQALVQVTQLTPQPRSGFAGEEFTIAARTDRPAAGVTLEIDGQRVEMTGSERNWTLRRKITEIGTKNFKVTARNAAGASGRSRSAQLVAKKSPLLIPDVASARVEPPTGFVGESFEIRVATSAAAEQVYVEIEGQRRRMQGSGTAWKYTAKIDSVGDKPFVVSALNKDGVKGASQTGTISVAKLPEKPVAITSAKVNPRRGTLDTQFTFEAATDMPASKVLIVLGDKPYEMTGSGRNWKLSRKIEQTGKIDIAFVALNADRARGPSKKSALLVLKNRFTYNKKDGTVTDLISGRKRPRFIDNRDGTITDLYTSLMWTKEPKTIAVSWESAVEYCQEMRVANLSGWRLPTISEIKRLRDKSQHRPALPVGHPFSNVLTHLDFWTKSRHDFGPRYVHALNLREGEPVYLKKDKDGLVWPVRYTEIPKDKG